MSLKRAILLGFLAAALFGQRKDPAIYRATTPQTIAIPAPSRAHRLPRPPTIGLGTLSAEERMKLGKVGPMRRVGLHRVVGEEAMGQGAWSALPDGSSVWRVAIQSDQASGMRVEFSNFDAGAGQVWVHTNAASDGPYTGRGPYGNGEFWSATVEGDSLTIEYQPSGSRASGPPPFHVHRISHQALRIQQDLPPQVADPAASCNLDVNCYPDWAEAKKSVAQLQFEETQGPEQGTFLCSGALVATRDNSFQPYLLTAGHCIHDEPAARSLETFWAYESDGCNLGPPSSRGTLNSQNGGHLLGWGTIELGDFSLVLLPNVPSGVVFSGWDASDPGVGSPLVGISHPMGSYKRIAFGHSLDSVDVSIGTDPAPGALYHLVQWDNGLTQQGSSGSPLFSSPGVIVGALTYGPDLPGEELCLIGGIAGYGKFSNAYYYLQPYLEDLPFTQVTPSATSLTFNGRNRAITGSATQAVALTVGSASEIHWSARADAPWIQISQISGSVSSSAPASFNVTVDPKYFVTSDTYTSTITILSGAAPPVFVNVSVAMKIDVSSVTVTASPDPVPENGTSWTLSLAVNEAAGASTSLTGLKIDGVDYSANIPTWFGGTHIAANGSLTGTIHTSGLYTPVTKYFEFFGKDDGSGQTWYRLVTVTFTN
ncbi:MAG: serine protease [Acidobacteriia bacterium]|nr:serine protease [Terriglobia bacterium]